MARTRPMIRPNVPRPGREIVKKPVLYGRTASQGEQSGPTPRKRQSTNVTDPTTKIKVAKTAAEEKPEPPSVEPTPDGHYELSPMLSNMVEAELEELMKKVREACATDTQDAAERVVADRFKNKAGDALRNTLGLNITKRLLNVHNPLYVKMVFSGKPLRAELLAFLKKYNVSAFKRVGERGGTFAAKMRSYQDFDVVCTDKKLKCGKIRVVVTPCYQFTTCPPNLRTRYGGKAVGKNDVASDKSLQAPFHEDKSADKTIVNASNQQKDSPKVALSQQNSAAKETSTIVNQSTNKPSEATSTTKVTPVVASDNTESAKVAPKVTLAKVENKPTADSKGNEQNAASKTQNSANQSKEKPKETLKSNESSTPKVEPKTNLAQAQNSSQKFIPTKVATPQNSTPKETPVKAKQCQKTAKTTPNTAKPTTVTQTKNSTKAVSQAQNSATNAVTQAQNTTKTTPKVATPTKTVTQAQNAASKLMPNATKTTPKQTGNNAAKATPKPATANKPKIAKIVATPKAAPAKMAGIKTKITTKPKASDNKMKQSDFDELNDHDILALISEGIVLDECSGSDVE